MAGKIGVAVLGLGKMGDTHVKAAKASPWVDQVIGFEPEAARADERGKALGIPATADLAAILARPDIKFATIASTNETHCELAIQCLRAGKAVLCEKPMGTTLAEARRMLDAERETGSFLQIGLELRYSRIYRTAKDWIAAGLIGRPVNTHCDYYCSEGHGRNTWRSNSTTSLIAEKLCHYLDLPRWWLGAEVEDVYSVAAPNAVSYFKHSDNHQIVCRFRDGTVSTLTFFMHTAETFAGDPLQDILDQQMDDGHRLTYLISGTKGAIETDVFRRRIRRWEFSDAPDKLHSRLAETLTYGKEEDSAWIHNVHGQNIAVSQLVAEGQRPFTSAADSFETMRVVFAAEISERERRVVRLDTL